MKKKIAIGWSSGKDSAYSLHHLKKQNEFEPAALFTTYNSSTGRLPIQGTPIEAVREQARCIGLPLIEIDLPENCPNVEYEHRLVASLEKFKDRFDHLAFGDLFLDGIKEYRESFLVPAGFHLVFPLMGIPTSDLAQQVITSGLRAKLCSVDSTQLDPRFTGREYDDILISELPTSIDPCGEKGEFHTFVYEGPIFSTTPRVKMMQPKSFGRFILLEMIGAE
jgi:uncharacterized protein (TIGR00290 family)